MLLITGASGLLGGNIAVQAVTRGVPAIAVFGKHRVDIPGTSCTKLDLTSSVAVDGMIRSVRPAAIVHCAAATNVDECEANPEMAFRQNVEASGRLAALSRVVGARFIYVSTDAVFNGAQGQYQEHATPNPINIYARSKLAGEAAVRENCYDYWIVRTNLFGWNIQPKTSLAEWVLAKAEGSEPIPGFTDVKINPLEASTLARLLLDLSGHPGRGLLHLGAADGCSKYHFAQLICAEFGFDPARVAPVRLADASLPARRPLDTTLDTSKARETLGRPLPSVREGVRRFRELRVCGYAERLKCLYRGLSE